MDHSLLLAPLAEASSSKFLHIPYDERWEPLKPIIINIYLQENNKIARLAERMKNEYEFVAQPHQYRYHFKKWGIKKRTTTEEKTAVITALGKRRLRDGASTSDAVIDQGGVLKAVDKKQLKRHMQDSIRHDLATARMRPGLFLQYSLPYAALARNMVIVNSPATPHYIAINSPESTHNPSSQNLVQTPTMQLVQRKVLVDRATLFLDGRERDLMSQMGPAERKATATWLHDYWMFSFMTSKYWGKGPRTWTLPLIRFKSFAGQPMPNTPDLSVESEELIISPEPVERTTYPAAPTQLCRWAIHYKAPSYDRCPSPQQSSEETAEEMYDIEDESTWTAWLVDNEQVDVSTTISQGLREGAFTAIDSQDVPLATDLLVNAVEKSEEELDAEAMGFAIMSRNIDIIYGIFEKYHDELPAVVGEIFPFHLAARYLDGAKTCCSIMDLLVSYMHESNSVGVRYNDGHGHTVLDALFIKILRSHSTVPAHIISDVFSSNRCSGDEVDPCGRWDADSPCVRKLYGSGHPAIQDDWKHPFCHTSVQVICHCLASIFMGVWRPEINTKSGLFRKRCAGCGMELALGPLHALVLTAFHLANNATAGETLFGIVACLTCLLVLRADPCLTVEVSIIELFGENTTTECHHTQMNPAELGSRVPLQILSKWSPEVQQGWQTFLAILTSEISNRKESDFERFELPTRTLGNTSDEDDDDDESVTGAEDGDTVICHSEIHDFEEDRGIKLVYCGNTQLGTLWAMIQGEFLTYRRITEDSSWISPRFSMKEVFEAFEYQEPMPTKSLPTQVDESLEEHSRCGFFYDADCPGIARQEEVCTSYFANLDDWSRTTFIEAKIDFYGY